MGRLASAEPLVARVWYSVAATFDASSGAVTLSQRPLINPTNSLLGRAATMSPGLAVESNAAELFAGMTGSLVQGLGISMSGAEADVLLAGYTASGDAGERIVEGHFNGKIDRPRVYARALSGDELEGLGGGVTPSAEMLVAAWDLADGIGPDGIPSDRVTDLSGNGLHGACVNMPARGMTGYNWTAKEEHFIHAPEQYGAIHFHDDDLDDAGWDVDFELTVPEGLKSDVYAARLRAGDDEDYVPFVVRPQRGTTTAKILFLMPTASYMAYANVHLGFTGAALQPIISRVPIIANDDVFLHQHLNYGLSTYDLHSDGSGVCYSSRKRPIINMRPKYRHSGGGLWQFPADLHLVDWLHAMGHEFDVITDEELHREGLDGIRDYNVVVTGSHPEYYSYAMLDAVETYVRDGGRYMYMGANGLYWIISYHPDKPHLMEVRKGEGGSRAWQAQPGEYFHSTTGERGGLWRNRGRPPQKLVGVGFTAEGFDVCSPYRRLPDSFDPRARFIFEGVGPDELIVDFGLLGGGAAGLELDRYDLALGTPPDALLLATSEGHSDGYTHVVEEIYFMSPGQGGTQDPGVRADLVYFSNPNQGAVFSTSSIAWCGSLSHNNYENNVSRITDNVLRQFAQAGSLPTT